eukprot:gb/GEZN01003443.1/.p1 GENE.gb/GEZN01003443.1/~~gb/GEZN01003443.1/.p1  ORF type:complete len:650 (-),score=77.16 gb/GEZN01003443.1/:173-2122(-)
MLSACALVALLLPSSAGYGGRLFEFPGEVLEGRNSVYESSEFRKLQRDLTFHRRQTLGKKGKNSNDGKDDNGRSDGKDGKDGKKDGKEGKDPEGIRKGCVVTSSAICAHVAAVTATGETKQGASFPSDIGVRRAIGLSGGGQRAVNSQTGVLRALLKMSPKFLNQLDAWGAVSGGSWFSAGFLYAENYTDTQLLGEQAPPPEQLTLDTLKNLPPGAIARIVVNQSSNSILGRALFVDPTLPRSQWWPTITKGAFLAPLGLEDKLMVELTRENVQRVREAAAVTPTLRQPKNFLRSRLNRPPVKIFIGVLVAPFGYAGDSTGRRFFQMSGDFIGSPYWADASKVHTFIDNTFYNSTDTVAVGGGFVESFAYGRPPYGTDWVPGIVSLPPPATSFSLVDAISISSNAAAFYAQLSSASQINNTFYPYWPIDPETASSDARSWCIGDGGIIEDEALIPMLQRGARQFMALGNRDTGLITRSQVDLCADSTWKNETQARASALQQKWIADYHLSFFGVSEFFDQNQVFPYSELRPLLCQMQDLKEAGKPILLRSTQVVLPNQFWGIQGGWNVDMVWYYLDKSTKFEGRLPAETQAQIALGPAGAFANFPIYSTIFQNPGEPTNLTQEQFNLLAAQSEWAFQEQRDMIMDWAGL